LMCLAAFYVAALTLYHPLTSPYRRWIRFNVCRGTPSTYDAVKSWNL